MDKAVSFDDLELGARYASGRTITLTEAAIVAFASEFDPQPGHLDAAAGQALGGGLSASGWHTAAVTMRLLTESGLPMSQGAVGVGAEIAWPTPARPGDELRLEFVVKEKRLSRSKPDRGVVVVEGDTINQLGEVRQHTRATMIMWR